MIWDTAANIINDAAVELGLIASNVSDPFSSTNKNLLQLCRLAKGVGQDLVGVHPWTHLQKEHTFSSASSTANYALPVDFDRQIDRTHWNRTLQLPAPAGVSPQQWQELKAVSASGLVYKIIRTMSGELIIHPTPTATETLALEYMSRHWVVTGATLWARSTAYTITTSLVVNGGRVYQCDTSGTSSSAGLGPVGTAANQTDGTARWDYVTTNTTDTTSAAADIYLFDRRLFVAALKLAYRAGKGFDTSAELGRYQRALERAKSSDGAAPVLSLNGAGLHGRLLDGRNAPETGYGSSSGEGS